MPNIGLGRWAHDEGQASAIWTLPSRCLVGKTSQSSVINP